MEQSSSVVFTMHRPLANFSLQQERLMLITLKASLQTKTSQSSYWAVSGPYDGGKNILEKTGKSAS